MERVSTRCCVRRRPAMAVSARQLDELIAAHGTAAKGNGDAR
jgi:hypothetical protein